MSSSVSVYVTFYVSPSSQSISHCFNLRLLLFLRGGGGPVPPFDSWHLMSFRKEKVTEVLYCQEVVAEGS